MQRDPSAPCPKRKLCTCGIATMSPKEWLGVPIEKGENLHGSGCPLGPPPPAEKHSWLRWVGRVLSTGGLAAVFERRRHG